MATGLSKLVQAREGVNFKRLLVNSSVTPGSTAPSDVSSVATTTGVAGGRERQVAETLAELVGWQMFLNLFQKFLDETKVS